MYRFKEFYKIKKKLNNLQASCYCLCFVMRHKYMKLKQHVESEKASNSYVRELKKPHFSTFQLPTPFQLNKFEAVFIL